MKLVAAVFADFAETFLGGESQLLTRLGSRSVLGHMLTRLMDVEGLERRCLFVRPRDEGGAREVLGELGLADEIDVLALDTGARPRRRLLRCGRKWNLEAWRGSPPGSTWFDEYVEPLCVARVLDHYQCEGVLCLGGHQPVLDVGIATEMLTHQRENDAEARFLFTQAPPGLAGIILRRDVTRELLEQQLPVGLLLSYRPEMPQMDPITKQSCLRIAAEVAQTPARLTADTRRGREVLAQAFAELGEDCDAGALCAWLRADGPDRAGSLPVEVELELTTDDPSPETTLRPRGDRVPRRRLEGLDAVGRLARQLATYDDRLVFLGGHGDPLLHPEFPEICRRIRAAGVCGLGVGTTLVELSDPVLSALIDSGVDVVEVRLDANSAATYRAVHNVDAFERVLSNIERIQAARRKHKSPQPLVVCSLTRCAATLAELEAFFERWIQTTGWAVILGYNEYVGVLPPDSLLATRPPTRGPCQRLATRMMLLADGQAVLCSQDVGGVTTLGSWVSDGLADLWRGAALRNARESHSWRAFDNYPLCGRCGEWFRP
ncbi:MAG: radical SAM/SPASM domain-containing protein [Phycisphaerae bacterium]